MTAATPLSDQPDPIYGADIPAKTSEKTVFYVIC